AIILKHDTYGDTDIQVTEAIHKLKAIIIPNKHPHSTEQNRAQNHLWIHDHTSKTADYWKHFIIQRQQLENRSTQLILPCQTGTGNRVSFLLMPKSTHVRQILDKNICFAASSLLGTTRKSSIDICNKTHFMFFFRN
ncbi:hypothetical protein ACJX0J_009852, partial [Zea mays]